MQYSSEAYQTHKDSYTPSQPIDGKTATGIPVSSTNQHYPPSAPLALDMQSQPRGTWTTGLCGCFEDCGSCCLTWWCPCVTFGRIAEIADRGSSSCGGTAALYTLLALVRCQCLYSCTYRSKIRAQYLTEESSCPDCLVHCCCEPCALCQEYRELHNRGFDMKIGWHANVERQNRGVANMPPTVPGGMRR